MLYNTETFRAHLIGEMEGGQHFNLSKETNVMDWTSELKKLLVKKTILVSCGYKSANWDCWLQRPVLQWGMAEWAGVGATAVGRQAPSATKWAAAAPGPHGDTLPTYSLAFRCLLPPRSPGDKGKWMKKLLSYNQNHCKKTGFWTDLYTSFATFFQYISGTSVSEPILKTGSVNRLVPKSTKQIIIYTLGF